jgi:hypothetical protein
MEEGVGMLEGMGDDQANDSQSEPAGDAHPESHEVGSERIGVRYSGS